jgi:predicted alpha/beta hydrolase
MQNLSTLQDEECAGKIEQDGEWTDHSMGGELHNGAASWVKVGQVSARSVFGSCAMMGGSMHGRRMQQQKILLRSACSATVCLQAYCLATVFTLCKLQ